MRRSGKITNALLATCVFLSSCGGDTESGPQSSVSTGAPQPTLSTTGGDVGGVGNNADTNAQSLKVNGSDYAGSWLPLGKIVGGGTMNYALSATPTQWAATDNLTPPSGPNADYTQMTAGSPPAATGMRHAGAR
ncbi:MULTISPECIES: hypothetical protein [unclassified Burkholderia]|uniref:hypothetical protein n=1 Tax=unclassified Burkholderia TaxID=2613784 RepID=UPI001D10B158|nr:MULTISPECIES: hypothetical protein [unclassified Burkholderia]